jgi:class 3 adenylate cyclase
VQLLRQSRLRWRLRAVSPKLRLVEAPGLRYARSGELSIAYQVVGDGPIDLAYVPLNLPILSSWEQPLIAGFWTRLASFARLILIDKRGTGSSDRPRSTPTLEAQMDDVRAVLDAVGSEEAALVGASHGAQMCALFAATYPERSTKLILWNAIARVPGTEEEKRAWLRDLHSALGSAEWLERVLRTSWPSYADDPAFRQWMVKSQGGSSPGSILDLFRTFANADITSVLPTIRVPTLVLYRQGLEGAFGRFTTGDIAAEARRLADAMPDAQLVAVPGRDGAPFVGPEVADEIERFLGGTARRAVPDRVLSTVLFTDIVGSTELTARLGDRAWRQLLSAHRQAVRQELGRFHGEEIDTAGDGFLASFDGPARAIACAHAIISNATEQGLSIRAGLHTGECEREDGKLAGIAVHIGARIAAIAQPQEILVSRTVRDLVSGSGIQFQDRGETELKGVPGDWHLYAVTELGSDTPAR